MYAQVEGTLLAYMDRCITPFGHVCMAWRSSVSSATAHVEALDQQSLGASFRYLPTARRCRGWLHPTEDVSETTLQELMANESMRNELREQLRVSSRCIHVFLLMLLQGLPDLERLLARIAAMGLGRDKYASLLPTSPFLQNGCVFYQRE